MVQAEALFDFGLKVIRGVRDMELNGLNVFGRAYLPASSAAKRKAILHAATVRLMCVDCEGAALSH